METLSDKMSQHDTISCEGYYEEEDVKKFIRKLKELGDQAHKMIDDLAGDKLI